MIPFMGGPWGNMGTSITPVTGAPTGRNRRVNSKFRTENGDIDAGSFLFDVVAIDPQTAWAVGIDGYVTKTTDGGKTWKEIATGAPKTQLFFVGSDKKDNILIGGKGVFFSSSDKGKTWQTPEFNPPIIYGWIYEVASVVHLVLWPWGWNGDIYLSTSDLLGTGCLLKSIKA